LSAPSASSFEVSCQACHTPFLSATALDENGRCALCESGEPNFDRIFTFGAYEGTLRKLIHIYKYGRVETLAKPFSEFLAQALPTTERFDLVLPMPMHWRKRWERGFNQAELLARPIARRYGCALGSNLKKKRATAPQASLSAAERRKNLKGSFAVSRAEQLHGKHVLLVDDVLTTGATLQAAASALKNSGASRVTALTLARADRESPNLDFSSLPAHDSSPVKAA
jgi:ComF family protein